MKINDYTKKYVSDMSMKEGSYSEPKAIIVKKTPFASIEYPIIPADLQYDIECKYDTSIEQVAEDLAEDLTYNTDDTCYVRKLIS